MRKVIAAVAAVMLLGAGAALSHAPSGIDLKFEKETGVLRVTFEHRVRDAREHFVYHARVRLNKKDVIEQTLGMQDDNDGGSLVYKINVAKAGDEIEVLIECVKGGSKTGKIKLE